MAIDSKHIRELVLQGLDFRPDRAFESTGWKRIPIQVSKRELQTVRDKSSAWRRIQSFTAAMSDEEFERGKAEALRLRDEWPAIESPSQRGAVAESVVGHGLLHALPGTGSGAVQPGREPAATSVPRHRGLPHAHGYAAGSSPSTSNA